MTEQIRTFLADNPIENIETFFDNENIFWVDWREYDEDIVSYVNDELSEADQIEWETIPSEKEGALDTVILKKDEKEAVIPYDEDKWDRDTTLKSIGKFIDDKYKLCWFKPSLGGDTLGFVVIGNEDWEKLSAEFGEEKLKYYFSPVTEENEMFNLSMDQVFSLIESREKNYPN